MSADIQGRGQVTRPPLYVPQGRPTIRTKNPMRPDWLDQIKRPLLIVSSGRHEFEDFMRIWKLDQTECTHVLLSYDLRFVSFATVILVLPGVRENPQSSILDVNPLEWWESRGGMTIDIPANAMDKPYHFSVEDNMAASTRLAIAQHRHLDSLNRR